MRTLLGLFSNPFGLRDRPARERLPGWARRLLDALDEGGPPPEPGEFLWWGDVPLPAAVAQLYFLIVGAIGSGKTTIMKALLMSIVPYIGRGSNQRMLMYDPKPPGDNLLTVLHAMRPRVEVVILTPSDVRAPRIKMPFNGPADIRQVWASLAPVDVKQTSGKFFEQAAQKIATAVCESLWRSGMDHDLSTVCQVLRSKEAVVRILARHAETRSKLRYFERPELALDVLATLEDKLDDLMILAAYWHHAAHEWSVEEFLHGPESVAFIGADARIERALSVVRRVLYKNLSEGILALPKDPVRRIWLPIDEMHTLGSIDESVPVPGLDRLATLGRSMGAVIIGVLQHVKTMEACYGRDLAESILDQFGNCTLLRCSGATMDAWQCERLGSSRRRERQVNEGENRSKDGVSRSVSYSYHVVDRLLVPKGTFLALPMASREHGIHGRFTSPAVGIWKRVIDPAFVDWLPKGHDWVPPYIKRPVEHETLPELDYGRVGLEPPAAGADPEAELRPLRGQGTRRPPTSEGTSVAMDGAAGRGRVRPRADLALRSVLHDAGRVAEGDGELARLALLKIGDRDPAVGRRLEQRPDFDPVSTPAATVHDVARPPLERRDAAAVVREAPQALLHDPPHRLRVVHPVEEPPGERDRARPDPPDLDQ